ncbi:MAG TPA: HEAT repeat domain-containing protein, partial [Spirochaetota bacterium]|nr:HEAT repeat domain-containing protein [Spirochaetota bacterium]
AEMVKDKNKSIRLMIIRLIFKNKISEQLNNLKTIALQDDDYEVIIESMNALSSFGDSSSSYIYIKLLSHSNYNVRKTAADKIARYRISSAASALNEQLERETDDYLKDFYISLLVSFRSSFIRGIELTALKDSSARLRIKAVASLGILRSDRSAGVLIQNLSDEDYRVRSEACNSLAIINAKSSCRKMTEMVKTEKNIFVRSAALYALEKIRDKSTIIPLYDILAEEKDEVFRMLLNNTLRNMVEKTI